jgi:hypothetical protein
MLLLQLPEPHGRICCIYARFQLGNQRFLVAA